MLLHHCSCTSEVVGSQAQLDHATLVVDLDAEPQRELGICVPVGAVAPSTFAAAAAGGTKKGHQGGTIRGSHAKFGQLEIRAGERRSVECDVCGCMCRDARDQAPDEKSRIFLVVLEGSVDRSPFVASQEPLTERSQVLVRSYCCGARLCVLSRVALVAQFLLTT